MKDILQAYKFEKQRSLRNFLTDLLYTFFEKHLADQRFDALAAVPLDSKRALERGFNQSALLSRALSKKLKLPELSGTIKRKPSAIPQSLLGKIERRENVKDVFYVTRPGAFKGLNVLLVDDILTTGQTASECARILKEEGHARSVTVLACARGV
jgi:ComF family protein